MPHVTCSAHYLDARSGAIKWTAEWQRERVEQSPSMLQNADTYQVQKGNPVARQAGFIRSFQGFLEVFSVVTNKHLSLFINEL